MRTITHEPDAKEESFVGSLLAHWDDNSEQEIDHLPVRGEEWGQGGCLTEKKEVGDGQQLETMRAASSDRLVSTGLAAMVVFSRVARDGARKQNLVERLRCGKQPQRRIVRKFAPHLLGLV